MLSIDCLQTVIHFSSLFKHMLKDMIDAWNLAL